MKKIFLLTVLIFSAIISWGQNVPTVPHRGKIMQVYGGDTATLEFQDGNLNITGSVEGLALDGVEFSRDTSYLGDSAYIKSTLRNFSGEDAETVSRTVYVTATGNDTTGTGAVEAQFKTIGKALSTIKKIIYPLVTITIDIGAGNFTISTADFVVLALIQGTGTVQFLGILDLVESGFTMGSYDSTDILKYSVSGGSSGSWTTNQWTGRLLKSGTSYYPITHNTNSSISLTTQGTGTEIYEQKSIVTFDHDAFSMFSFFVNISFYQLQIIQNNSSIFQSIGGISMERSFINNSTNRSLYFGQRGNLSNPSNFSVTLRSCTFYRSSVILYTGNVGTGGSCYFYGSFNGGNLYTYFGSSSSIYLQNLVFENINTSGANACGVFCGDGKTIRFQGILKFINIPTKPAFLFQATNREIDIFDVTNLILINTGYLFTKQSGVGDYSRISTIINSNKIKGTPNTRWFYDNMYEFVNPTTGRNIQIPGIVYPEFETNLSATLENNTTTNIQIGDSLQNQSITIEYTCTRGTTYEKGTLQIVNKMASLVLSESTPIGDDCGLSFAVSFVALKKINLAVTTTNTVSGTFKYNVSRVMRTPITL